eukprot:SAG25_NODE_457_length_7857_cov_2.370199_4_plen_293_part_00
MLASAGPAGSPPLIKVRAVTNFVRLSRDTVGWDKALRSAAELTAELVERFHALGYETQTLRVVTNPFGEFLDCSSADTVLGGLQQLKAAVEAAAPPGLRIRLAVGEAKTAAELALVPVMITEFGDLCNICVNIGADEAGLVDAHMCDLAAGVVCELARSTPRGEGNFNFTANFACPERIPYFPAGYLGSGSSDSFAIGLEHPDLLLSVLEPLRLGEVPAERRGAAWSAAAVALQAAMESHVQPLVGAAQEVAAARGIPFSGLDSSAAPSKDVVSICKLFEALGVSHFGATGE